jgi:hypothetical protein
MDITRILNVTGLVGKSSPAGWWYTYPSEKYKSQIGSSSQLLGKIKFMIQITNQLYVQIWILCPGWCYTYPSDKYWSMGRMNTHIWNGKSYKIPWFQSAPIKWNHHSPSLTIIIWNHQPAFCSPNKNRYSKSGCFWNARNDLDDLVKGQLLQGSLQVYKATYNWGGHIV